MFKLLSSLLLALFFVSCASRTVYEDKETLHRSTISSDRSTKSVYYLVKKGDSLWKIAKQYGVSIEAIRRENKIHSSQNLKVGQKIILPGSHREKNGLFLWPTEGSVINSFGESVDNSINYGLNIRAGSNNPKIKAAAPGKVVFADTLKTWGCTIILQHHSDLYTIYANLEDSSVREGNIVKQGQVIGCLNSEQNARPVLHFEIRKKYLPCDPRQYLN